MPLPTWEHPHEMGVFFFSVWFKTTLSLILLVWECWYARRRCTQWLQARNYCCLLRNAWTYCGRFRRYEKWELFKLDRNLKFQNTDAMSPLQTTGVGDSYVHSGFLLAYNTVALAVLDTINAQVAAYPSYQIVVAGHSLGGAVAFIATLSIKAAVPNAPLKLFTYGRLTSSTPELSKLTIVCAPRPT